MKKYIIFFILFSLGIQAQNTIKGVITGNNERLPFATIYCSELKIGTESDEKGFYELRNIPNGTYTFTVSIVGFQPKNKKIECQNNTIKTSNFTLVPLAVLDEVVVSGTLKPVNRLETPVPVEVYTKAFLKKNPTPNVFEAMQNVNGVRPQLNCNVCNTGDIHINGLEGPYTMITIDGMPIVSGLSTVYGLSGIPNSLIERIEVVKGPASSLFGSEAVGGLINIITKKTTNAPLFSADFFATSWKEYNLDVSTKFPIGKQTNALLGVNYYNYSNPVDANNDNFTDITLQDRISIFNTLNFQRKTEKEASLISRFFYEDRWGGEMQWNKNYRGGNEIYGESIYTTRYEMLGKYELPFTEHIMASFSYTNHNQNSVYGATDYQAKQEIAFGQLVWDKTINKHDFLLGTAYRYQFYNDNTPATIRPEKTAIFSVFAQNELKFTKKQSVLLGARYDYNNNHGSIFTPRFAYKWKPKKNDVVRVNAGTGFRVVNLFTEEHAALTGAREVVITENLKPERSYNATVNYLKKIHTKNATVIVVDLSAWYTYFTNQILPDYDTNPNQIIYANLNGYSQTIGITANTDFVFPFGLSASAGITYLDTKNKQNGIVTQPILTEKFSGTWSFSYTTKNGNLTFDYTGNIYGKMRLPLLGDLDPRAEYSPVWSIQNIQATYKKIKNIEIYGGVKNLLNWTPNKNSPFLIARANDPFDENVTFDSNGNAVATPNNPYGLTFDPSYVYAPNQGIRAFIGLRYNLYD